jgi:hypothetical protein
MNDVFQTLRAKLIQEHARTKDVRERLLQKACKELAKIALEKGLHFHEHDIYGLNFVIADQTSQEWTHANGFHEYAPQVSIQDNSIKRHELEGLVFEVKFGLNDKKEKLYYVEISTDVTKPIFTDFTQSPTHAMSKDLYAPTKPERP